MKPALIALADGAVFRGRALGYEGETVGEVVFNTAMTGYQEVLTDPSYKGQIITMTCPHIDRSIRLIHVLAPLRNPLTYDRGKESAEHERLTHQLAIQIFFTVPHSPWEHGTNEKPQEACYDSI